MSTMINFFMLILGGLFGYLFAKRYFKRRNAKEEREFEEKVKNQKLKFVIDGREVDIQGKRIKKPKSETKTKTKVKNGRRK